MISPLLASRTTALVNVLKEHSCDRVPAANVLEFRSGQPRDQLAMTILTPDLPNHDTSFVRADIQRGLLKNLVSGLHQ
jgi:hypothetical protein